MRTLRINPRATVERMLDDVSPTQYRDFSAAELAQVKSALDKTGVPGALERILANATRNTLRQIKGAL